MLNEKPMGEPAIFANIQLLRLLAALSVVLFHLSAYYPAGIGESVSITLSHYLGFFGVDVFFLISGFVMAKTTQSLSEYSDSIRFIVKRFYRIYISYWPFALTFFLILAIFEQQEGRSLLGSLILIGVDFQSLSLPIAWTLQFELLFYFGVFVFTFLPKRWMKFALMGVGVVVAAAQAYAILLLNFYSMERFAEYPMSFLYFVSLFWFQFLAGFALYFFVSRVSLQGATIAVLVLFGTIYFAISSQSAGELLYSGSNIPERVLVGGVLAFSLLSFALYLEKVGFTVNHKVAAVCGDLSYAVYLGHLPVLFILFYFMPNMGFYASLLITVTLTLVVSWLFHKLFEGPLLSRFDCTYNQVAKHFSKGCKA